MDYFYGEYDVAVVGAGHAGCEAALACARLGLNTIMFTMSTDSIAMMPCNPHIGGSSKGHIVREIDALGGEMGKNIDRTYLQIKMLNKSKGPAVQSLRAQADKQEYSRNMRNVVENQENLTIKQEEVTDIITDEHNKTAGVKILTGRIFNVKAVVLCTGVYLHARCIVGETSIYTGPNGTPSANHLTESLIEHGVKMLRFKTGTPARIDKRTIDFSKLEEQGGDEKVVPFSFTDKAEDIEKPQVPCFLTYTNEETHKIIRDNISRSPLYSGTIKGIGPRYCPSIEDKVMRFPEKNRHQIFVEPESLYTNETYLSGMSSSMPEDVQLKMYRTLPGFEHAQIVKHAYAIEYDCINPDQLKASLEFKNIENLFSGGQFNGSSGYEEAAGQGLVAGINAAMKLKNKEPLIIDRSEGYIGVLIDDLVTKETLEPYRMMTSRAEYRLILRQDNADLRLTPIGYRLGLISKERYDALLVKETEIAKEEERLYNTQVTTNAKVQEFLTAHGSTPLKTAVSMAELIKRPELDYEMLKELDVNRPELADDVKVEVEINIKYDGYIKRQLRQVEQFKKLEKKKIPADINYDDVMSLRIEARDKLKKFSPANLGQASRIQGVSPADVSVLLVYIESKYRRQQ